MLIIFVLNMKGILLNCRNSDYNQNSYSGKYGFNDRIYSIIAASYKIVSLNFLRLINRV